MQNDSKPEQVTRYKPGKFEIYGFWGILKLIYYFIRTKLMFPKARLIRYPIVIRGKRFIKFGKNFTTGINCRIEAWPYVNQSVIIEFGNNIEVNDNVHIAGLKSIKIGNNVLIASRVFISDINHGSFQGTSDDSHPESIARFRPVSAKAVKIDDNAWIGEGAVVLPGVRIGRCSIIGANSVVTKDIPSFTIAGGNPAKLIKKFDFDKKIWIRI